MKKKFVTAFVVFMTVLCFVASADSYVSRLVDGAGLLSGEEYDRVLYELERVSQNHGMDIVVVTADTFEYSYNAKDEATEIYEMSGYGQDGIMLYLCMDTRDCRILTTGFGIEALNDEGIEYILDCTVPYFSEGEYADGFLEFASQCDGFVEAEMSGEEMGYMESCVDEPFDFVTSLVICLVIGFVIALIVTGIWRGQLKSVAMKTQAGDYIKAGSFNITGARDLFLYRHIDRTEKPQNTSKSGTSTYRSSSGRSYGGGGRKF